jgi:ER degradation enhancer, mannosidase alpha-like 2
MSPSSSKPLEFARAARRCGLAVFLLAALSAGQSVLAQSTPLPMSDAESRHLALEVKQEFLHAWRNYERLAWGHDELKPLSKTPRDWYGQSLLMTPVDALDTLVLMGLTGEAGKARRLIDTQLSFDKDIYVKNFEITIRMLGGLLSAYRLTGDARLLALAHDLGTRLLPAFKSPTGLPYEYVNLRTGQVRGTQTNPAETGTLLLEFGTLSKLTGEPVFFDTAKRSLVETFRRRSSIGLVGESIDVESGQWTSTDSHISGGIDSYYEYLWKCWKLFGDQDCLDMWKASITAVNQYLADELHGELWYGHADMNTGSRTSTEYGALDAYFPAVLAFSGDLARSRRLQDSSFKMWNLEGIEPEVLDYRDLSIKDPRYALRPEIVESTYYLYRLSGEARYRLMGRTLFEDLVKYCRTDAGYADLESVRTKQQKDAMPSYLFAETFKYFYLLFSPPATLDFDAIVFNTEAHPLSLLPHVVH